MALDIYRIILYSVDLAKKLEKGRKMSEKIKRFRIFIDFDSKEDMQAWAQGTEKRPYEIKEADALDAMYSGPYRISKFVVTKFLDEDAPLETDLHPIAQGLRFSRLG